MLRILRKEGFASFVEVIVSAIIFIIAAFGIFTTISSMRPHGTKASNKLQAAYIGKSLIEQLHSNVDASTWDEASSPLALGFHSVTEGDFTVNYQIVPVPGLNLRKLVMNIYYPD